MSGNLPFPDESEKNFHLCIHSRRTQNVLNLRSLVRETEKNLLQLVHWEPSLFDEPVDLVYSSERGLAIAEEFCDLIPERGYPNCSD